MATTTESAKTDTPLEKQNVEHIESGAPPPGDTKLTWQYVLDNKRVLAWCMPSPQYTPSSS